MKLYKISTAIAALAGVLFSALAVAPILAHPGTWIWSLIAIWPALAIGLLAIVMLVGIQGDQGWPRRSRSALTLSLIAATLATPMILHENMRFEALVTATLASTIAVSTSNTAPRWQWILFHATALAWIVTRTSSGLLAVAAIVVTLFAISLRLIALVTDLRGRDAS